MATARVPGGRPGHVVTGTPRMATRVLAVVWVVAAGYALWHADRGWFPHDEGMLGQSAERVLAGELPHRDFVEVYTGGLSYLHAGAFALFGVKLSSLRLLLLLAFAATVPAFFYLATRFLSPVAAGATVLLAVVWSLPSYPAPLPSWYNLIFAVLGCAALCRFVETRGRWWLVAAGLAAGLSFLIKISGLYYLAAGLLFLVFFEQEDTPAGPRGSAPYRLFAMAGVLAFAAAHVALLAARPSPRFLLHFLVPALALAGFLIWNELRGARGASAPRFSSLLRLGTPFMIGAAIPVALFLVFYAAQGALGDFVTGVFVRPSTRFVSSATEPPSVLLSVFSAVPLGVFLAASVRRPAWRPVLAVVLVAGLAAGLATAPRNPAAFQVIWHSVRTLVPFVTVAALWTLGRGSALSGPRRGQLFALTAVTAMVGLVQFPFASWVYFFYVAPLLAVLAAGVLSSHGGIGRFATVTILAFYGLFGALWVNRSWYPMMGYAWVADGQTARLMLPRGGLRVHPDHKAIYERLVALIDNLSPGEYIYATPDCPEVYFLAGRRNPTRAIFEFLEPEYTRAEELLPLLDARDVRVVVVNRHPQFSPPVTAAVDAAVAARYPDSTVVGEFVVRWRP